MCYCWVLVVMMRGILWVFLLLGMQRFVCANIVCRWYMGAYSIYMQIVFPKVLAAFEYNRDKRNQAINALTKIISIDQELALLSYFGVNYSNPPEKQQLSPPVPSSPATITPPRTPPFQPLAAPTHLHSTNNHSNNT